MSIDELAKALDVSTAIIERAVKSLVEKGLLVEGAIGKEILKELKNG